MTTLGGGIQGISPTQTINNFRSSQDVMSRRIVTKSWNTPYATGTVNGYDRKIGEFRAVNNLGDFLSRKDYICGGSNQINSRPGLHGLIRGSINDQCDGTGVASSSANVKFVSDSSDYITYKKRRAINRNYNDVTFGGDENNASYVNMMRVRR